MSENHLTEHRLSEFNLPPELKQGIDEAGFIYCTPIQATALPLLLADTDVAGQAQTGTGKTATFLIAALNRLLTTPPVSGRKPNQPRAIIIAPTRELAVQIHKDALLLGKYCGLATEVVYGGTGYESQRDALKDRLDILIGTPGRIIDYHKQHIFDLNAIDVVVLDEADRMFDLGFIKDIRYLLRRMPKPEKRLSLLFSATLTYRVLELSYEHMNNPHLIRIEPDKVTAASVKQAIYYTSNDEKIPLLLGLLKQMDPTRSIIFVNTKEAGNRLLAYLEGNGIHADVLSGDVPQKKRLSLLLNFQKGELPILVATDVAARGLHIPDVSHVFNFDLPQDAEDYVHRIGRTARAGASGDAISFACEDYSFALPEIEQYIGYKIPTERVSQELLVTPLPPARRKPSAKAASGRSRQANKRGRNNTGRQHKSRRT